MKKLIFVLFLTATIIKVNSVFAQEDVKSPFVLKEINISTSETNKKGNIHLKVETVADGEASIEFHASEKLKKENETYDRILGKHSRSNTIEMNFPLDSIEDGFHLVELGMGFKADDAKKDRVASYQSFPLYFQIKNGEVIEQGDKPNELFNKPPQIIDGDQPKAKAIFNPVTKTGTKSLFKVEKVGSTYQIYIYIYGKVRYQQSSEDESNT
jgi:5-hydroxyisourate hydrolase-like protein (transthyretin family)